MEESVSEAVALLSILESSHVNKEWEGVSVSGDFSRRWLSRRRWWLRPKKKENSFERGGPSRGQEELWNRDRRAPGGFRNQKKHFPMEVIEAASEERIPGAAAWLRGWR